MKSLVLWGKKFWKDEEGIETLELMLIIAVVVFIALMFRNQIKDWMSGLISYGNNEINQFEK